MKKLFALMMALCLLLGTATAETVVVNWEDYFGPAIEETGIEGEFVTFDEIAVKIWLPSQLQAAELTDEDRAEGYIGYFSEDSDNATVAIVYVDTDGMTIEEYAAQLQEIEGVSDIELAIVNGLPCVNYQVKENDTLSVAFSTQAGYILEITMYPLSVEGAEMVWGAVASSIQAAE